MLSRISSLRRHAFFSKLLAGKLTFVRDASLPCRSVSEHGISTAGSVSLAEISPTKTSAEYSIFKGRAALTLRPVLPKFSTIASGHQIVDKRGVVLLKFLPAIGLRKYDNEKKQFFALSATEVGCLISLGPSESCEFFHDPSMKSSTEGQIKKTLSISPLSDGSGYIFSLSVTNSIHKTIERFTLPVNKGEFSVMRSACSFALPHILGWDRIVRPRDQARHSLFIPSKKQSVPGSEYSK